VSGKGLKEQVIHTSRLWEFTPRIDKYESEDIVNSNTMQPATSQTVEGTEETKDTTLISADKVEIAKVIVKNKSKGKEKGKLPDPVPIEDTHVPITITVKRNTATRPMYLVKYKSNDLSHEMIKQFIETIQSFMKQITKNEAMTPVSIKKKLFGWIKRGGAFFKAGRTCNVLTKQVETVNDRDFLLALMNEWITQLNFTFTNKWNHK
jgi:hypothetical protein